MCALTIVLVAAVGALPYVLVAVLPEDRANRVIELKKAGKRWNRGNT